MNSPIKPFTPEDLARRRKRNIVMAWGLVALIIIFFVTTLVRLGASLGERAL
jgi:hypothetical protein